MPENLKLSTPWVTLYRQINALFGEDPDVRVEYSAGDGEDPLIKLYVNGSEKAEAIGAILPSKYEFGNVVVEVCIIPANVAVSTADLYRKAFEGNPAFSYAVTVDGVFTNPINYIVFRNKVVQFFNDDLSDVNGNETTLYEDIAREVFHEKGGVSYCTDIPENVGKPIE